MQNTLFRTICVPIDGSPAANAAVEIAQSMLVAGGEMTLVNALNRAAIIAECTSPYGGDPFAGLEALEENQRLLLDSTRERCAANGVTASSISLDGNAEYAIAEFVKNHEFDAIVMGTHARHGLSRLLLGSTAEKVLCAARAPVIVTSEGEHSRLKSGIRSILVAFDQSEPAQAAAQFAVAVAHDNHAKLAFVHISEGEAERDGAAHSAMVRACDIAARRAVSCERVVLGGDPASMIATAAAARLADLIVIGTHGRGGLTLLRLGSIAAEVIRNATVPVMVVPAAAHVRAQLAYA
jgi:nucleotide-binding universal stress UspA family protein